MGLMTTLLLIRVIQLVQLQSLMAGNGEERKVVNHNRHNRNTQKGDDNIAAVAKHSGVGRVVVFL